MLWSVLINIQLKMVKKKKFNESYFNNEIRITWKSLNNKVRTSKWCVIQKCPCSQINYFNMELLWNSSILSSNTWNLNRIWGSIKCTAVPNWIRQFSCNDMIKTWTTWSNCIFSTARNRSKVCETLNFIWINLSWLCNLRFSNVLLVLWQMLMVLLINRIG